ncbi:hypothetical protein FGE12_20455 [Aggregicoccus sp. 17bor-14]|uniref:hypothetical protein n=1 Tax=Myxococcaceae TaxID=31 RepID=UPI00129C9C32|nr:MULTISPECIES: hypothetical protein [Myxococcaceae]MBF5044782.1 hypothetical protein [Simulacricoccus sp. 17bor-14]MRI90526.1 hypothetical protein [Aggregicoccus sp. 17bor-14]
MTTPPRDPLLQGLAQLPVRDVPPHVAFRIARRARARLMLRARQGPLARAWDAVLEPALTAAFVLVYLGWAVQTAIVLLSPR